MHDGRLAGGLLLGLGVVTLVEARRLVTLRTEMLAGAVVGDDTFPLLVAVGLLALGAYLAFGPSRPRVSPALPGGAIRTRMLWSAAALVTYCAIVPYLGYTGATLVGSTALFRTMGAYRLWVCLALGAVATATLYLLFRVWLRQPLPAGMVGF